MPNTNTEGSSTTRKDLISVASSQLGYRESGTNIQKYGPDGQPWCHYFVSWCARQAGIPSTIVPQTGSTTTGMNFFKNKGRFGYKGSYTPKRNDLIYFKSAGASHVGIVEYVSGGTVHTIEGNTSDCVARRSYPLNKSTITGYGKVHDYIGNVGGTTQTTPSYNGGTRFRAHFTAYYPDSSSMEGGYYDSHGHRLDPSKQTCASLPRLYGTKILVGGTGTKIDNRVYTITDTGGSFKQLRPDGSYPIDILMSSAAECNAFGRHDGWIIMPYTGGGESYQPTAAQTGVTQAAAPGSTQNTTNNSPLSAQNDSAAQKQAQIDAEYKYIKDFLARYEKKKKAQNKDKNRITELKTVSTGGKTDVNIELLLHNSTGYFTVPAEDGLTVTWERKCTPGKLVFTTIADKKHPITPGNEIRLTVGGRLVFYGFVFTTRKTGDGSVQVTAYDQMRYLKNKDTLSFKKKTATQIIKSIAKSFGLQTGTLANSKYKVTRVEDNQTLMDMIQSALDDTLYYTGRLYTLYDKAGKLCLKSPDQMKCSCLLDTSTGSDYVYTASIDKDVYDYIKLEFANEETGKREQYIAKDSSHINAWGRLQYYDTVAAAKLGPPKAKVLLMLYNEMSRTLALNDFFGDFSVRAGSLVPVMLDLGDMTVKRYMLVDKVTHKLENGLHTMSLSVSGGGFESE